MSQQQTSTANEPYPGLRPYQEDEQNNFFGRDDDTRILLDKLLSNRLTLLFAASGIGKSSLLNAAILPQLKDPFGENLTVVSYHEWFVEKPLLALLDTIRREVEETKAYQGNNTLPELLTFSTLFTRHPLVLVLDQFEEFFRYQRGKPDFGDFIEQLTEIILKTELPINVVISMREDFALELNAFKPKLPTLLFENYYRLERMTPEAAREAIEAPLKPLDFSCEPELLDALSDDLIKQERDKEQLPHQGNPHAQAVEPPYLQIVCSRLWELNKNNTDKTLTLASYKAAGRAEGIISHFLEKALSHLSRSEKQMASKAFDYLAARRNVKMAYPLDVLSKVTGVKKAQLKPVLDKLESKDVRILNSRERDKVVWYELYHDMFTASVERWNNAWKEQQLRRQRWINGGLISLFLATTALLIDSFLWIQGNYFPANYLFQEQKFRLMHWGLLPEPLPEMVEIPLPEKPVSIGEYDEDLAANYNGRLKRSGSYSRQNFGAPLIEATITKPFALGKFEISYEQYDYFVWQQHKAGIAKDELHYPTGATRDNGRGDKAVTQVSWDEAIKYTKWLSEKTGDKYRLPNEAEWEYAARAGSQTGYWWGEAAGANKANCKDCGSDWKGQFIAPIGSFESNEFGLHNTAGNVWEWTCSEWKTELEIEFTNDCVGENPDTSQRVIRGGSWDDTPVWLRSSARFRLGTFLRNDNVGFRVLRLSRTP